MRTRGEWKDGWYVVPYDVQFNQLDFFGHVNNATFFTLYEVARTDLWLSLTGATNPADIGFIVAHAACDFKKQLGMEHIEIVTRFGAIGNSSIEFLSEVRQEDGTVAATGRVVTVLFDWERRTKVPIGDDLRQKIAAVMR
ncbi:MAG: acyl-CoA thioester hydrolase [Acidobacteriota bacterium]|jgi:acyl-CoA thioester hydrolase|nr:acyl-CoA thioester hydrolase [Acidobacteriota bacterium]